MEWSYNISKRCRCYSLHQNAVLAVERNLGKGDVAECGVWRGHSAHMNAYIFTPYRGTGMYLDAVSKGYIDPNAETNSIITGSILEMPTITQEEILGLVRTFSLYVKFPKEEWPEIAIAEKFTSEGDAKFAELSKGYYERFFDHDFKRTKKACFSTAVYNGPKVEKQPTEVITG
jgi:hypothetical protein